MRLMRTALFLTLGLCLALVSTTVDAQRRPNQRGRGAGRRPTPAEVQEATEPAQPDAASALPGPETAADPAATTPAASPTATDAAAQTPAEPTEAPAPDLGPLREEFTAVMDDLIETRARIATLGRSLFHTRLRISVQNRAGDLQSLARIAVFIDGAPVFRAEGGEFEGDDGRQVFEGFAAPGPHAIVIEVEQRSRDGEAYRYTLRDNYRFEVLRDKLTDVTVVLDDDSGIGEDFPDDEEGEYDVRTRVRVATREIDAR